jgi:hypothetical protein
MILPVALIALTAVSSSMGIQGKRQVQLPVIDVEQYPWEEQGITDITNTPIRHLRDFPPNSITLPINAIRLPRHHLNSTMPLLPNLPLAMPLMRSI